MSDPAINAKAEVEAIIIRLEEDLRKLSDMRPKRRRAVGHLESAIKCLKDPREHIHPSDLNSANDG